MRYIKRKTNVRRHDRECRHKVADVRMHERNLKPRRILGVIPLKSLTYPQAKVVFPSIEPYGDIDEDKVINKRDCRPFDVERQDDMSTLQRVKRLKTAIADMEAEDFDPEVVNTYKKQLQQAEAQRAEERSWWRFNE